MDGVQDLIPTFAVIAALAGLVLAYVFFGIVRSADPGSDRMVELMGDIQKGARAFLRREYTWIAVFVVVLAIIIFIALPWGRPWGSIAYILGAVTSGLAGFIGMTVATMANARTAEAAKTGPQLALPLAFRGGAVMGFSVAGLSLLGVAISYIVFHQWLAVEDSLQVVTAFTLGASSIALFARIGGGIYTKAADMGADLSGKVEAGIPEDDPRNPATIADNVGDNVGDVAGMGADLFESYAGSIIAPIALAGFAFAGLAIQGPALVFPLAIAAFGMLAAILGAFTVKAKPDIESKELSKALTRGTKVAAVITVVLAFVLAWWLFSGVEDVENWLGFPIAVVAGLLVGLGIGHLAEYFTSDHYKPTQDIAKTSQTGTATNIVAGVATGKLSVAGSVLMIVAAIGVAFFAGQWAAPDVPEAGTYGIALTAIGMLATLGVVVSTDAYGPIADNAGGIAEMAHLDPEVREVTDSLDSLGNTMAAVAKGFAIGSAAVTALALFRSFEQAVIAAGGEIMMDISQVDAFVGLFIGAMVPFLFAALTMQAVGRAADKMIIEVRRQFNEIPGLREGQVQAKPDYARCVDISTQGALKEMVLPGSLAVFVPIIIGLISVNALGGFLAGALVTGFAIAIYMANAGGAWDNAKKYIEAGNFGGKGTDTHAAAVVGDTVGDPFKDTSGPAMNILIKVMTIVSLIFATAFVDFGIFS
ncbi:sodium-translocating pyrophosphatase [Egibacter rhizosphaerae]|uniref:Putative K(+)-stimulated pyrophosphate-energized sodium pump n=1 Tax=Egibacter rhizosphaerae TaxID=1670831 RepID=A0A411YDU9_9ACTN|nr:sodium-translocating pyrophosphatase [Egibacter rhizosphaerae]QBI19322.1 sodium-translocating pyrophosphatase [Egibacter rhizosphaerae]